MTENSDKYDSMKTRKGEKTPSNQEDKSKLLRMIEEDHNRKQLQRDTGKRLRDVRNSLNLSQSEFAEMIKVHEQTLSKAERGVIPLSDAIISKILTSSSAINRTYLVEGKGQPLKEVQNVEYLYIPRLETQLSTGEGMENLEELEVRCLAFRKDWVRRKTGSPDQLALLEVVGNSMTPTLEEGDLVLVDKSQTKVVDNKIFAIIIGDQCKVKRLKRGIEDTDNLAYYAKNNPDDPQGFLEGRDMEEQFFHEVIIMSDNKEEDGKDVVIPERLAEKFEFEILGRVIWVGREI